MNVWFGTSWGAPVCETTPHVAVPVGETCAWCDEPIAAEDSGIGMPFISLAGPNQIFYHVECFIRSILGSTGHQLRLCSCFGGDYEGESPEMSKRDAARAAFQLAQGVRHD